MNIRPPAVLLLTMSLLACDSKPPQPPSLSDAVAVVHEDTITVAVLGRLLDRLPEHLRSDVPGVEGVRGQLQILIDRSLILNEARTMGIEQDVAALAEMETHADERLFEIATDRLVNQTISYTEAEVLATYEENDVGWQLWPAHILLASEEDAWDIHRLLEEGADFATLAKERSLGADAPRGGELREWFDFSEAVPPLRDATFGLSVGQWSVPVKTIHGWEIVKILDKRRLTFAQIRTQILQQMQRMRWVERRATLLDSLKRAHNVRVHPDHIRQLLASMRQGPALPPELAAEPLVEWRGGAISHAHFASQIVDEQLAPVPVDSTAVYGTLERHFLPKALLIQFGKQLGMAKEPVFLAWKQRRFEQVLIERYRARLIQGQITVTVQEARDHYDKNGSAYSLPGQLNLTEALVDTEQEALAILDAVKAGEDFETLAIQKTKRKMPAEPDLHMEASAKAGLVVDPLRCSPYHQVFQDSSLHEIGVIHGPIVMENRYALFRLNEKLEPYYLPFPRAARQIRAALARDKTDALFNEHMQQLRVRHADRIVVDDDLLRRFVESGTGIAAS